MAGTRGLLDVLCVGFANQDLLLEVDGYPPQDSKIDVRRLMEQGGGPAATAAVAIARLGGRVALVSALGADRLGEQMLTDLAAEGVDTSYCPPLPGVQSALSVVVVDRAAGTRNIFTYRGTAELGPERVDPAAVRRARVLLLDANLPQASLAAARLAHEAGIPVLLDSGVPRPGLETLFAMADYPMPPQITARWATGEEDPERAARAMLRGRAKAVVVTMGADGYVVATPEGVWREPAFKVEVVDSTGAGDAFHGGFAYAFAKGASVREAARFGAAVAALKCRRLGGRTGLPRLPEVEALLAS